MRWSLYEEGPESDVVFTTRVRLARNVAGIPFPGKALPQDLHLVLDKTKSLFSSTPLAFAELRSISALQRRAMLEAHVVSPKLTEHRSTAAVAYSEDGRLSVMINEEDHIRIQAMEPGCQTREAWSLANALDDFISRNLPYAFDPELGYLTSHVANLGTGMRVSVMVHLPALKMLGRLPAVLDAAQRLDVAVRGLHGENTASMGSLYQVSNRYGIGKSETDILTEVEAVVKHLIANERSARHRLYKEQRLNLEDAVWRAYGVLSYARSISSEEALEMLSCLRLGQLLEIVPINGGLLKRLMLVIQPGMLQTIVGPVYSPSERDRKRADALRFAITRGELESLGNCPI